MNMHTTIPPADTAAAIWRDACRDRAAIVQNPRSFIRLGELLSRFERGDVEAAVDMLIDTLDAIDGDPDLHDGIHAELTGERCDAHDDHLNDAPPVGEGLDGAGEAEDAEITWAEWSSRGRHKLTAGGCEPALRTGTDDDEIDDEDSCAAGDDDPSDFGALGNVLSNCGQYNRAGDPDDAEPSLGWHGAGSGLSLTTCRSAGLPMARMAPSCCRSRLTGSIRRVGPWAIWRRLSPCSRRTSGERRQVVDRGVNDASLACSQLASILQLICDLLGNHQLPDITDAVGGAAWMAASIGRGLEAAGDDLQATGGV